MAEVKHFLDQQSIQQDGDLIKGILDDVVVKLEKIKTIRVDLKGFNSFASATQAAKDLAKTQDELIRATEKLATTNAKLAKAKEAQLRADTQQVKLDEARAKSIERLNKEQQKVLAASEKEVKQIEKNNNAYIELKKNYELASQASLKRGAELLREAKGNEALFKSLTQTDKAYQSATVEAQRYSKQLLQLESSIGRSQRNVGNYASAYNGLSRQFGLIANELPSLTISVEQFALALSNNLPIAAEELRATSNEIKRLKADGQAAPTLFSKISKSLLSFQVIISIVVTLLVAFSGAIVDFIKGLNGSADATRDAVRAANQYKLALESQESSLQSLNTELDRYLQLLGEVNNTKLGGDLDTLRAELQILEEKRFAEIGFNKELRKSAEEINKQIDALRIEEARGGAFVNERDPLENVPKELIEQQKAYEKEIIDSEKRINENRFQIQLTTVKINNQKINDEEEANKKIKDLLDKRLELLLEAAEAERKAREKQREAYLQAEIDFQQEIIDNEELAYETRATAAENLFNLQLGLQKINQQSELAGLEDVRKKLQDDLAKTGLTRAAAAATSERLVQERRREILVKYQLLEISTIRENQKLIERIELESIERTEAARVKGLNKQLSAIEQAFEKRKAILERQRDEEIVLLQERAEGTGMSFEEQKARELEITTRYNRLILKAELDKIEALIRFEPDPVKKEQLLARVAAIQVALNKLVTDEQIKNLEKLKQKEQELADLRKRLQDEILNLSRAVAVGRIDDAKNSIQGEIDLIEEKKRKEIDFINATTTNEIEKAARITNAEKKAQVERERLEFRQRQLDIQRAKFEKAYQVAQIVISTIREVAKLKAQAIALGTNPATLPFGALSIAGVPLVLAIGAAQAAAVLATPIPKFKTGKGQYDKYEGPAWVGDGGKSEMIFRQDGSVEQTPSTPTLTYVGKDDIIHPDANALVKSSIGKQSEVFGYSVKSSHDFERMNTTLKNGFSQLQKTVQNKRELLVNVNNGKSSIMSKDGNRYKRYLNDNLQFGK